MAAHLEGKGCGSIDMAGLAQKGGAVYSHIKIAAKPERYPRDRHRRRRSRSHLRLRSRRLRHAKVLAAVRRAKPASSSIRPKPILAISPAMPISRCPSRRSNRRSRRRPANSAAFCDATSLATALVGNFGRGEYLPRRLCLAARSAAVVGRSLDAGDRDRRRIRRDEQARLSMGPSRSLRAGARRGFAGAGASIRRRRVSSPRHSTRNSRGGGLFSQPIRTAPMPKHYAARVRRIAEASGAWCRGRSVSSAAAANGLFKLMAVKDEYEVARLYSDGTFARDIAAAFEGIYASPSISRRRFSPASRARCVNGPSVPR